MIRDIEERAVKTLGSSPVPTYLVNRRMAIRYPSGLRFETAFVSLRRRLRRVPWLAETFVSILKKKANSLSFLPFVTPSNVASGTATSICANCECPQSARTETNFVQQAFNNREQKTRIVPPNGVIGERLHNSAPERRLHAHVREGLRKSN